VVDLAHFQIDDPRWPIPKPKPELRPDNLFGGRFPDVVQHLARAKVKRTRADERPRLFVFGERLDRQRPFCFGHGESWPAIQWLSKVDALLPELCRRVIEERLMKVDALAFGCAVELFVRSVEVHVTMALLSLDAADAGNAPHQGHNRTMCLPIDGEPKLAQPISHHRCAQRVSKRGPSTNRESRSRKLIAPTVLKLNTLKGVHDFFRIASSLEK
jgi:hypothetical protein